MKNAERVVMVLLLLVIAGSVGWLVWATSSERAEIRDAVARGEYEIRLDTKETASDTTDWRHYYPATVPVMIGDTLVEASVADTLPERIQGLSGTPFLPKEVVKLFVFDSAGNHSIWMKDMNYAIDIMWAHREGIIVHIEEDIGPETYPDSFASPQASWFVIEASAGFVATNDIQLGDQVNRIQ